jgi:hypothetical protein
MRDRSELLAELMALAASLPASGGLAWRLCEAARRLVGADGAAVTLVAPGNPVVASTGEYAEVLTGIEYDLGEGPGLTAAASGRVVVADLREGADRWPLFARAASDRTEAAAVTAVPLRSGSAVLGVLRLHRVGDAPLDASPDELEQLADVVAVAVAHEDGTGLGVAPGTWTAQGRVNQAVGMVMAQLAVTARDALAVLRAHAFALDVGLQQVADDVLERRLSFASGPPP